MTRKTARGIHIPTNWGNMSELIQIILRNWPGAEDFNPLTRDSQDGGLQSVGAAPAIKDHRDNPTQFRMDILRGNRTDSTEAVCTWGGKR